MESANKKIAHKTAINMWRRRDGRVAQISAVSDTVVTLTNRLEGHLFHGGENCAFSADPGAATVTFKGATTPGVVTGDKQPHAQITDVAIGTSSSTLTFDTDLDTVGTFNAVVAGDDWILFEGDQDTASGGSADYNKMYGMYDYIVGSSVSSTSVHNVDRTTNTRALAGHTMSCSGKPIAEALVEGTSYCSELADPDSIFIDPTNFRKLKEEIRASTRYNAEPVKRAARMQDGNKSQTISIAGVTIDGDRGPVDVFPDLYIEPGYGYIGNMSDAYAPTLFSIGPTPSVLDDDGLPFERVYNADAYEGRHGAYQEFVVPAPGMWVQLTSLGS
jgi:hypothetical protein